MSFQIETELNLRSADHYESRISFNFDTIYPWPAAPRSSSSDCRAASANILLVQDIPGIEKGFISGSLFALSDFLLSISCLPGH
jgi:hypothetical protein